MSDQPSRLVQRLRVNTADRIANLVKQHERYMRRDRSSPVWIRVKRAGEEGGDVVGKVQYLVRHSMCKKKYSDGVWSAVLDNPSNPHPGWTEAGEVYIVVREEEVQVTLAEVTVLL